MKSKSPVNPHEERISDFCLTKRASIAACGLVLAFSALSYRIFAVQVLDRDQWTEQGQQNRRQKEETIPAPRGSIFDQHDRLLASDEMVQSIVFDNIYLNEKKSKGALDRMALTLAKAEQSTLVQIRRAWSEAELQQRYISWVASLIAPAIGKSPQEITDAIERRTNSKGSAMACDEGETVIAKEINALQSGALKKLLEENPLGCLRISSFFRRNYPSERDLTHIIGLINVNGPVCGVEYGRREDLKGTPGFRKYEVDGRGNEISGFQEEFLAPVPGKSLRVTIDTQLQDIVEEHLDMEGTEPGEIYVPGLDAKQVTVVLMDAKTMAIRAIACRKRPEKDGEQKLMLQNPACDQVYEPGSTMKIVTVAAALNSGKVSLNTVIPINGPRYKDDRVSPINDDEAFDSLSVRDILVHSSNIGAYKLACTVGMKDFVENLHAFRFAQKTGLESNYEKPGQMQKVWNYDGLARTSFGYAIDVTPVQMCAALGVLVNDGYYQAPYLVEEVMDHQNKILSKRSADKTSRVISASAARATRDALMDVVDHGTGTKAQSSHYYIAGKTATARKLVKQNYVEGQYVVSFLGYAPADNPKLLGIVIIDTPKAESSSQYGGKLAAPVFRRIMDSALLYYEVPGQTVTYSKKTRHP